MQEGLQDHDERQRERRERNAQPYETLEQINARRHAEGLPALVPYTPKPEKQSRRRSRKAAAVAFSR